MQSHGLQAAWVGRSGKRACMLDLHRRILMPKARSLLTEITQMLAIQMNLLRSLMMLRRIRIPR